MANAVPLLRVEDLSTEFRTERGVLRAVDGVTFELERGESLGIVGESGSGKSVLVRTIIGLLNDDARVRRSGDVWFRGRNLSGLPQERLRDLWGREVSIVLQDPMTSLNPVRKIGSQVAESMRVHLGMSRRGARARALELLGEVGITDPHRRLDQYPHELSGGMRQRVSIAIAISCEPQLLIADEPTTALDVTVQRQLLDLLQRLRREHEMALILITHDLGVASGHTDRVAVMYAGEIVELSRSSDLFAGARHPYSSGLLGSIPRVDLPSHTRLRSVVGQPPDLVSLPTGCRFRPRCERAQDRCGMEAPSLLGRNGLTDRAVRCFFPVEVEDED